MKKKIKAFIISLWFALSGIFVTPEVSIASGWMEDAASIVILGSLGVLIIEKLIRIFARHCCHHHEETQNNRENTYEEDDSDNGYESTESYETP